MIKITLQGNATKYTPEQVKTNLIIMSDKLNQPPGDIIVHGRPTGPWTVWLSVELAEELIIDKEIDMFDIGENPSFQTFLQLAWRSLRGGSTAVPSAIGWFATRHPDHHHKLRAQRLDSVGCAAARGLECDI